MFGWMHGATATSEKAAAQTSFNMQKLRRQASWGCAAVAALLVAVLSGRSDFNAQRTAALLSSTHLSWLAARKPENPPAPPAFNAEAATRQLALEVRRLAEDRNRIMSRLDDIEHNIDDMTGSITRELATTKAASDQALMATAGFIPPGLTTPETYASLAMLGMTAPDGRPEPAAAAPSTPAASSASAAPTAPAAAATPDAGPQASEATASPAPAAYGVELGSAHSIKTLHARWAQLHAAHAHIFAGLTPIVELKNSARSDRIALRLVVGPLPNAERAAHLCAALAVFRLPCQPTMFDSRHLTLR